MEVTNQWSTAVSNRIIFTAVFMFAETINFNDCVLFRVHFEFTRQIFPLSSSLLLIVYFTTGIQIIIGFIMSLGEFLDFGGTLISFMLRYTLYRAKFRANRNFTVGKRLNSFRVKCFQPSGRSIFNYFWNRFLRSFSVRTETNDGKEIKFLLGASLWTNQ